MSSTMAPGFSVSFDVAYLDEGNKNCEFIVANGVMLSSGVYYEVTVSRGEDIVAQIYSICRNGPSGVRVLKAQGVVSGITLHPLSPTSDHASSTTCTHQGLFRVESLEGVLLPMEETGGEIISTGLQFSAFPKVPSGTLLPWSSKLEGVVSGSLIADSQVVLTLGVYKLDCHKLKRSVDQHGKDTVLAQVPVPRLRLTTTTPSGKLRLLRFKAKTPLSDSSPQEQERSVRRKMETLSLNDPRGSTTS